MSWSQLLSAAADAKRKGNTQAAAALYRQAADVAKADGLQEVPKRLMQCADETWDLDSLNG